jgi:hypothetical protein
LGLPGHGGRTAGDPACVGADWASACRALADGPRSCCQSQRSCHMAALSCQVSPNRYATLPGGSANRRDAGIQVDFAEDLVTDLGFRLRASVQVAHTQRGRLVADHRNERGELTFFGVAAFPAVPLKSQQRPFRDEVGEAQTLSRSGWLRWSWAMLAAVSGRFGANSAWLMCARRSPQPAALTDTGRGSRRLPFASTGRTCRVRNDPCPRPPTSLAGRAHRPPPIDTSLRSDRGNTAVTKSPRVVMLLSALHRDELIDRLCRHRYRGMSPRMMLRLLRRY